MPRSIFIWFSLAIHVFALSALGLGSVKAISLQVRSGGPMSIEVSGEKGIMKNKSARPPAPVRIVKEARAKLEEDADGAASTQPPGAIAAFAAAMSLNPAPVYPPAAVRDGIEGLVEVEIAVDSDGRPTDVLVVKTSGSKLLDEAALDAAKRWHFSPAESNLGPIRSKVVVPVRFALSGRQINKF